MGGREVGLGLGDQISILSYELNKSLDNLPKYEGTRERNPKKKTPEFNLGQF